MPNLTPLQYAQLLHKASQRIYGASGVAPSAKPEPAVQHEPLAEARGEKGHPARCGIRITSYRKRLCDPDNLCGKYLVDALRYQGIIRDDTAAIIDYSICQQKVASKEDERTVITITPL